VIAAPVRALALPVRIALFGLGAIGVRSDGS
jgi:hypothetical protein